MSVTVMSINEEKHLTEEEGQLILEVLREVHERCGIDFSDYRQSMIRRRVARRMTAIGSGSLTQYLAVIRGDGDECQALLGELTINFSHFFRDPALWDLLRNDTVPGMLKNRESEVLREFSAWSAGCGNGEEPYSLAILLKQVLGPSMVDYDVHILATDVDRDALVRAREGAYFPYAVENVPEELAGRYFEVGHTWQIADEIMRLVDFREHDLVAEDSSERIDSLWSAGFDIVFCRNVLIYLMRPLQARVLNVALGALRQGGYLILGTAESLPEQFKHQFDVISQDMRVFRRR